MSSSDKPNQPSGDRGLENPSTHPAVLGSIEPKHAARDRGTETQAPARRPGPKDLARALNVDNIEQLAARIIIGGHGVSGRTLYKWFHRGAPFTSEAALVSWAGNQGLPVAPVIPSLGEVIDQTMAQIAPTIPAEQGVGAPAKAPAAEKPPEGWSPSQIKAMSGARLSDRQTYRTDLEIAEMEKVLVHRDRSVAMIKAFAHEILTGLTDLVPRTLRGVPSDIAGDLRQQVREALQTEITRLRTHLADQAPKLLRQVFGEEGTTP